MCGYANGKWDARLVRMFPMTQKVTEFLDTRDPQYFFAVPICSVSKIHDRNAHTINNISIIET